MTRVMTIFIKTYIFGRREKGRKGGRKGGRRVERGGRGVRREDRSGSEGGRGAAHAAGSEGGGRADDKSDESEACEGYTCRTGLAAEVARQVLPMETSP